MNQLKHFFISLVLLISNHLLSGQKSTGLQILSSTDNECTFTFSPIDFRLDTVVLNGTTYQNAAFAMSSPDGDEGDPMLPCRILIVGLPNTGGARVSLVQSDFIEKKGVRIPPVPRSIKEDEFARDDYREGDAYRNQEFMPLTFFKTEKPAIWRDRRIIKIRLYPVQFNPARNTIRLYTRMTLRIDFEKSNKTFPQLELEKRRDEILYKKTLINYEQAKRWRISRRSVEHAITKKTTTGERYKIPIYEEGVYKITGAFLENNDIDIESIEPSTLKIYNNGGRELPRSIHTARPDSLIENPVLLAGMDDNRFDENDYLLFYGKGVTGWEYLENESRFAHYINRYTDRNIYWLVFNDNQTGKRIVEKEDLPQTGAQVVTSFRDLYFLEQELTNPAEGGISWFGHFFSNTYTTASFQFTASNPVPNNNIQFRFQFKGATSTTHQFSINLNNNPLTTTQFSGQGLWERTYNLTTTLTSGQNTLSFAYGGYSSVSQAYLDWFEIEYEQMLNEEDGLIRFNSLLENGKYDYHLTGFDEQPLIFDITEISDISQCVPRSESDYWTFLDSVTELPKTFFAVQTSGLKTPVSIAQDEISDLRNPANEGELLIITHGDFINEAMLLKNHRETHDSLSVYVADIQDVFDEFSWGLYDPVAVRDFAKFAFENWLEPPAYLLLLGDGDYDYRNIQSNSDKNWIPPFEYDALSHNTARAYDDWYTYVAGDDSEMDLSVGRLPVQTREEAATVVNKVIRYESEPLLDNWRNLITMVGDDEISGSGVENEIRHTEAAEYISQNNIPPVFNFNKIYLTEYPEVYSGEGRTKPTATRDLLKYFNNGTLIVNWIGHGHNAVWAHEKLFERDRDMPLLNNGEKLPLVYAATCHFGQFDKPDEQSFTEELLNTADKGAIAVISATRECGAAPNEDLNKKFMNNLLHESGPSERLGDAMRIAKAQVGNTSNSEMYHIFGDPSMRLSVPRCHAVFTSVSPDTFKALGVVTVSGQIEIDGSPWNNFDGTVGLNSYNSKRNIVYTTEDGSNLSYQLPGNAVFRGETQSTDGTFEISFIVPKDISYGSHTGRLSCYFYNEETDGNGYRDNIEIGGSIDITDVSGPDITLYFAGQENFTTGEMVTGQPELIASIRDDVSGVNISGEIGHKIMLTLDDQNAEDVSEYFQYDEGSYLEGQLHYLFSGLEDGEHDLMLKAWDNANNSSAQSISFTVVSETKLKIKDVLNYPNPMSSSTYFTFQLSRDADIGIKIFTVSGRLIRRLENLSGVAGFNMFEWDGRDDMGDIPANGVYLYKVIAKTQTDGDKIKNEELGRLVIMR